MSARSETSWSKSSLDFGNIRYFYLMEVKIEESWKRALQGEFEKPYFAALVRYLHQEKASGAKIFPPGSQIFKAFELTPLDQVKAVILGQDPYHGYGQAMGLSFSVPDNIPAPPSLKNIFKEIEDDLDVRMSGRPNLEAWARQGVLLLNAILTVRAGEAASHRGIGWQEFTDAVIRTISERCDGVVFLLWGNFARGKAALIDSARHLVLEAAHPSPLAGGAFFGCRHFSKTNAYLRSRGKAPIDWKI
jgi:uracil-DNA glycosylase